MLSDVRALGILLTGPFKEFCLCFDGRKPIDLVVVSYERIEKLGVLNMIEVYMLHQASHNLCSLRGADTSLPHYFRNHMMPAPCGKQLPGFIDARILDYAVK